jgi:hypothetical protein
VPTAAEIVAALTKAVRQARNDTIVEVTANLREPADEGGTPVDTGWARANWIPTVGAELGGTAENAGDVASAASVQEKGLAEVAGHQGRDPVFVGNVVPYVNRLNDGWSKQAPSGFVERAVAKAEQTMQELHTGTNVDIIVSATFAPRPSSAKGNP